MAAPSPGPVPRSWARWPPAAGSTPAGRVEALLLQGWLLAGLSDAGATEAVARQLDQAARPGGAPLAAAAALLVRARLAEQSGGTAQAGVLVDQAVAGLPADAGTLNRLRFASAQSHIRNSASRLDEAIRLDHQALKLADAQAPAWRQAEVRNDLAYSYHQAGQMEQARKLSREAMDFARQSGDAITLAHAYTVQGIILDALGDKAAEKDSLQSALDHARRAGAKYEESLYLANLADHFLKKSDYATALRYAQAALPLTRELKNLGGETVALANIGLAQIALHDIESGKRNLRASIDIDERRGSITGVSDSYAEMAQYLERAGDAKAAIEAWHQHRALAGQILARDQQQAILEMQEQFDAERRVRELALLQRDGAIKTEALRAHELQQRLGWLVAASAALAVGVVLIGAHRVRLANRQLAHSNALLQRQAEIDPLTGLANRRHLQEAMRRLGADGSFSGTVFLADLDHFKRINDWPRPRRRRRRAGAGGAAPAQRAARCRPDRALGRRGIPGGRARPGCRRRAGAGAAHAGRDGRHALRARGPAIATTVSIGYATFPIEPGLLAVNWERAIGLVDTAMYLAKAHGRNRAYGVRMLRARDPAQFEAVGRALETAWLAGEVTLTPLSGPADESLPADAAVAEVA